MVRSSLILLFLLHIASTSGQETPPGDSAPAPSAPLSADKKATPGKDDEDLGWCRDSKEVARVCIACALLPGDIAITPTDCCSDSDALMICTSCLDDPLACQSVVREGGEEEEEDEKEMEKRFGMLFMGNRDLPEKRFGTLGIGGWKRTEVSDKRWGSLGMSKRFGMLNIGGSLPKRYGMLGLGNPYLGYLGRGYGNMGKRFGTLNMGGGRHRFAKRWGTLNMGKKWGTLNMDKKWGTLNMGKRWGTLNMGKRWGTLNMANKRDPDAEYEKRYGMLNLGKRYSGLDDDSWNYTPSLGKRYGTLNMGSYAFFPHKRNEYVPYNGNIGVDMKKRYGRLFMGRTGGKRLGAANDIEISDIKK